MNELEEMLRQLAPEKYILSVDAKKVDDCTRHCYGDLEEVASLAPVLKEYMKKEDFDMLRERLNALNDLCYALNETLCNIYRRIGSI